MVEDSLFEVEELTDQDVLVTPKQEDDRPVYGSKEWNEFVMSKFERHELIDKNPICAGLRRVAASSELILRLLMSGMVIPMIYFALIRSLPQALGQKEGL
jgi:hypothetical protein